MSRYIDADKLALEYRRHPDRWYFGRDVLREINEAETVDAVKIVRCADCKHWTYCESEENDCDCYGTCGDLGRITVYDWFCADGEKKDGDDDG